MPTASQDNPQLMAAMAAAGAMALSNPLLLNPLLFSTSNMASNMSSNTDLLANMKNLLPGLPAMAAAMPMMSLWSLTSKKPSIADTFANAGSFNDQEVSNIRHLLEAVNANVTRSLLEDNLKKWASKCGLSTNEILQQLAHAQPLSPGQLMVKDEEPMSSEEDAVSIGGPIKRSNSTSSSRPRAMISDDQVAILKAYYSINPKPRREDLLKISEDIGQPFKVVKVWFQNTRARDRREGATPGAASATGNASAKNMSFPPAFNTKHLLPPTPPASCSTGSQKHPSPVASPQGIPPEVLIKSEVTFETMEITEQEDHPDDKVPLDLSTKSSTPSATPPPLVINSEAETDTEGEEPEDEAPPFTMTSRPPIDIEQLAKQHFDNMIRAKLVTLEPTAEAMLPDAPVLPADKAKKKSADTAETDEGSSGQGGNGSHPTIYTCDQCDKTFTKKSSITRHKYEHSGNFWANYL